jgi:hypothetical protein
MFGIMVIAPRPQVLRWRLCPPTVCDWVMQFFSDNAEPEKPRAPAPAAPRHVRAPTPRKVKALRYSTESIPVVGRFG